MINKNAIRAVFESSLKLKSTESCLIVTDTIKEGIGRAFYEYAVGVASRTEIIVINPTKEHGVEPPEAAAKKMLEYDVEILITEKSLTHTRARREATNKGARIATMPSITEEIANRCLDIDYNALKEESNHLYSILKEAKEIYVITSLGTDIKFTVGSSSFFGKDGGSFDYAGAFGNLPEGEISFAPQDSNGIYIVDASFPDLGILESPLTFKVKEKRVYEIIGARSKEIIGRLDKVGPQAYEVAELGIGLNPKARIIGNILEDEKVIGTVHIALGNNLSYGGTNDVPLHLDGVIKKATLYVDGRPLLKEGKFI